MPQDQSNHWLTSSIIYQLFAGRLTNANILDHQGQVFKNLQSTNLLPLLDQGINCLYLLGVWDNRGPIIVGEESGQDLAHQQYRLPSPFSISDHQHTNPDLGTNSDLNKLINTWHNQGFKVILDFIPNHTSTVHPWVKDHREYYYQKDGNHIAEFSRDVYKLDYSNPGLAAAMLEVLLTIADLGADGVRCDMAHLIPIEFWQRATKEVKTHYPDFVFTAEVYPDSPFNLSVLHQHLKAGFDAVYHGPLYNNLKAIITDHQPLQNLVNHLNFINSDFAPFSLVNYLANHDDPLPSGGIAYLEALLALELFLPGVPFVYNGLLSGLDHRLAHHYYDPLPDEFFDPDHLFDHFKALFKLRRERGFLISNTRVDDTSLLVCNLTDHSNPNLLVANFSPDPKPLSSFSASRPGLLHQLTSNDSLPVGTAEIFTT